MTTELWDSEAARFIAVRKEQVAYNQAYAQRMHMPMLSDMAKQNDLLQLNVSTHGKEQLTDEDMKSFADKLSKIKGFLVVTDVKDVK
ncbi:MAG TPA: hypothetical protein VNI53_01815 [Gammaproteobacteria bacterium]|nr:hypothetical protein [Gammaproteobacteria bacterium]